MGVLEIISGFRGGLLLRLSFDSSLLVNHICFT
jgi:hypothetical protein